MSPLPGAIVLSLLQLGVAQAQSTDQVPPPGKPRPALVVTPRDQKLPNGLRVIVAPRTGVGLVTATLLIRSGSEVDPLERAGLAELAATLLTRGTKRRSAPAIAEASEAMGGSLDASAGWDRSRLSITVATAKLGPALDLLADVTRNPLFAAAELERARRQALDGLRVAYSEPGTVAQMAAARVFFGAGTYGAPRMGTPASLARITQADLKALHARVYRPDNAILVLAGDIEPAAALDLARRTLGRWKRPALPLVATERVAGASSKATLVVIDMPGAGQAGVAVTLPAAQRHSDDYYAGLLANAILGGSSSSRLATEIRIKRGLTYDARSAYDPRRLAGLSLAMVQTNNPSAPEVVELALAEIARLSHEPVADAELKARATNLIGAFGRSLETTSGLAGRIGELALFDIDLAEMGRVVERIEALGPADVRRYAATYWNPAAARVIVAGDAQLFAPALNKKYAGEGTQRVIAVDRLDLERPQLVN